MTKYLETSFSTRPALDPLELLTDEETAAIIEREQREADERYGRAGSKHLPGQHDQLDHGDRGSHAPEVDPLEHVHFTIGTLDEDEQKTVHETLDRLAAKYPAVASMITAVQARPLKNVWGRYRDTGELQLTNLGKKYKDMHDPALADTVTHEFAHAMFRNMAGITEPNEPPEDRPPSANRQLDSGVPVSVIRERIRRWNEVVEEYNATVQEQRVRIDTVVTDLHRKVGDALGHDADRIWEQLSTEFADPTTDPTGFNPRYVADNPEELLAQAFSHYETGKHGVIADIVGRAVDEHYGVRA